MVIKGQFRSMLELDRHIDRCQSVGGYWDIGKMLSIGHNIVIGSARHHACLRNASVQASPV